MAVVTGLSEAVQKTTAPAPAASPAPHISQDMVDAWIQASKDLELANLKLDALKKNFAAEVPNEPGEHIVRIGEYIVTVHHQERWDWDQDKLKSLFDTGVVPEHVQRRFRVDKKTFNKLDHSEQQLLEPALTRKIGQTKIKLEKV